MGGIKYYQLSKDEELPDEFCAVKDIGGEPSEYTFYVPEADNAKLQASNEVIAEDHAALCEQNAKLRKLAQEMHPYAKAYMYLVRQLGHIDDLSYEWAMQLQKLGIKVPE